MSRKDRFVRLAVAAAGTVVSFLVILCFVGYLVMSVMSVLSPAESSVPEIFDDEERGVWCYYYGDTMECFAAGEDQDDSVPEDERYEKAGTVVAKT